MEKTSPPTMPSARKLDPVFGYDMATLDEILEARERRARAQHALLASHGHPVITLSLNIPGPCKRFPLAEKTFNEAKSLMLRKLARCSIPVLGSWQECEMGGSALCLAAGTGDALRLKRLLVAIEESLPLARIFDMDVLDATGQSISRRDLGYPKRRCLLCQKDAALCARSCAHPPELVFRHVHTLMEEYFRNKTADRVAGLAVKSLLYEVCVTPKPGLVDRNNSGSHHDMDMFSFLGSASVLFPYFREATLLGLASANISPDRLFAHLRSLGMEAEDSMFAETHGVNTHKGAIFLFGILCAATGRVHALGLAKVPENICQTVALMTRTLAGECREIAQRAHPSTNGEALIQRNNILGVRGEVMAGLPSVRTYSLPLLETLLARNCSPDRAGAAALLNLVANVTDTNVIRRSSLARAGAIRKMVRELLDREHIPNEEALLDLDDMFIRENISPGGCADLLGVTFFLHFLGESPG